jgi:hypothetical protein
MFNGKVAQVYQGASTVAFTNEHGASVLGTYTSANQVSVPGWNLTATITASAVNWSNGAIWTRQPSLWGTWMSAANLRTSISQTNLNLSFTNAAGATSAGTVNVGGTQVVATGWGNLVGNLVGENQILWTNGSIWTRIPDIGGYWRITGSNTGIVQNGVDLTFINEQGQEVSGRFTSPTTVFANGWNLSATLQSNGVLQWANSTSWTRNDISGWWQTATGQHAQIFQRGFSLVVARPDGVASVGQTNSPTTIVAPEFATNNLAAVNATSSLITWADNSTWSRIPSLSGSWTAVGPNQGTRVFQVGSSVVFVNRFGATSRGQIVGPVSGVQGTWALAATDWGNLQAALFGSRITWSNGAVWAENRLDFQFGTRGRWPFAS